MCRAATRYRDGLPPNSYRPITPDSILVGASEGMTAADLENTLTRGFLLAVRRGQALSEGDMQRLLEQAIRTQAVDPVTASTLGGEG